MTSSPYKPPLQFGLRSLFGLMAILGATMAAAALASTNSAFQAWHGFELTVFGLCILLAIVRPRP